MKRVFFYLSMPLYFVFALIVMTLEALAAAVQAAMAVVEHIMSLYEFWAMSVPYASCINDPRLKTLGEVWHESFSGIEQPTFSRYQAYHDKQKALKNS